MRRLLLTCLVVLAAFSAFPQDVQAACSKCKFGGITCFAEHCYVTGTCGDASFGQPSFIGCEVDENGACQTSGDACRWALSPLTDEAVTEDETKEPS